jgi:hypothetical protein
VGVSTGLWISDGDPARRLAAVARWATLAPTARPDFASVNVNESGFADLVEVLRRAGIAVEAGVWSTADARALAAVGSISADVGAATAALGSSRPAPAGSTRILVEIIGAPADPAVAAADTTVGPAGEPPRTTQIWSGAR